MAPSSCLPLPFWLLLLMFLCISINSTSTSSPASDEGNYKDSDIMGDFLQRTTPTPVFLKSVRLAIEEAEKVAFIVSKFTGALPHNFRLSHAVVDCLDLLDFTTEELRWTLDMVAVYMEQGKKGRETIVVAVIKIIQQTTSRRFKVMVECGTWKSRHLHLKDLRRPAVLLFGACLQEDLSTLRRWFRTFLPWCVMKSAINGTRTGLLTDKRIIIRWLKGEQGIVFHRGCILETDRRLLQLTPPAISNNGSTTINVVVAADGSGNFTKIMDAVSAAPDKSTNRFIIYIKRGIYNENVDIKKKKWNLISCVQLYLEEDSLLYAHSLRQFYRECLITGTVDFIFGNGAAIFQKCNILSRQALPDPKNSVTEHRIFNSIFQHMTCRTVHELRTMGRIRDKSELAWNASSQAINFTVARFIDGNSWLPSTEPAGKSS